MKLLICLLCGAWGAATLLASEAPPASLVETVAVERGMVNPVQTFVGTLNYDLKSALAAEQEGAVAGLYFTEGQAVRKGEALVELDHALLDAEIAAASARLAAQLAQLENARRDLNRTRALFERNSVAQSGYDAAFYRVKELEAQSDATRSEIAGLNVALSQHRIAAPFDGVVTERNVQIGEWVSKGKTVATIVSPQSLEARISLPAHLLPMLEADRQFHALIGSTELDVGLKAVIPVADAATRTFIAELNVPARGDRIEGMRIDVDVPTLKSAEALLVPRDAVIKRFGQTVVFAMADGKALMLPAQVIGYKTGLAAISAEGLQAGMKVITKGNERIFPNSPVREKATE